MTDEHLDKPGTTPAEQTGEPATQDSERPQGAGREADDAAGEQQEQDRTDWKGMALGLKGRLEEINRQQEQEQRLRAAQPSPTADPQMAQAQAEMARIQRAVVQIQQAAEADDPAAVAMMALLAEQYQSAEQRVKDRRELLSELELLNISDAEERQATRAFWNAHRNEYGTLAAARKGMLGERFEKEREALAQKSKKADEAIAAARPDRVETYARPVPRSEAKARTMPESEFDNEIARLSRDGDTEAVRALMRELRSGTLKTTRG